MDWRPIVRSLTNYICNDPTSKSDHTLKFQVDMNLGGHYATTILAKLRRTQVSPQPQPPGGFIRSSVGEAKWAAHGCGCQSPVNLSRRRGKNKLGLMKTVR